MAMVSTHFGKIGLLGGGGLLGTAVSNEFGPDNIRRIDWRGMLTGSDDELHNAIRATGVATVVNCAAHTNVEAAEDDPETDRQSNAVLPARLARACAAADVALVHFSSTGCYGNWQDRPYTETDPCRPTTNHHRHKFEGEEEIRKVGGRHMILRTGWLFGSTSPARPDFVAKRIEEASKKQTMTSDAGQLGNPTYTKDVARQLRNLIEAGGEGLFNVVNTGQASRFEYVREIVVASDLECEVLAGPAFIRKAKVSFNEMALTTRLDNTGLSIMSRWQDALRCHISERVT
jgi:dTDP-4-dehydrorhamnose reductase